MPKPFTGKRDELKRFMQNCKIYLQINKKKYDTDLTKIGFVLALMNDKDSATWKEQVLDQATEDAAVAGGDLNLGTYAAFEKALQETFQLFDAPGDVLEQMKNLRMKQTDSIDDHIAKFKMLVVASKIGTHSPVIIDLFRESLFVALQSRLLTLEVPPKMLDEWYSKARNLDNAWKGMRTITRRTFETKKGQGNGGRKFTLQK